MNYYLGISYIKLSPNVICLLGLFAENLHIYLKIYVTVN